MDSEHAFQKAACVTCVIFVHNFTLKITSARAWIRARLNKGPVVSLVEKNKGPGYKTSKYGTCIGFSAINKQTTNLKDQMGARTKDWFE